MPAPGTASMKVSTAPRMYLHARTLSVIVYKLSNLIVATDLKVLLTMMLQLHYPRKSTNQCLHQPLDRVLDQSNNMAHHPVYDVYRTQQTGCCKCANYSPFSNPTLE